jgi:hypothetical protein
MHKAGHSHARCRLHRVINIGLSVLTVAGAAGTGGLATATVAQAGTSAIRQYGPPPPPPTSLPGFTTVVTSVTICPEGGIVGPATVDGASAELIVPPGAFSTCVQVTIFEGDLATIKGAVFSGFAAITAIGVQVTLNGTKVAGTFAKPLTLIVDDLDITAASIATTWNGVSLLPYPDATATAGEMQITFDTDPDFAVLTPASEEEPVPVTG